MYNIIYADPPWQYRDKALAGNRGAGCKYPVMTLDRLMALPVEDIAANDCILFMWTTMPMMHEALYLMDDWGFAYKTAAFTWIKTTKAGTPAWGMGRWTRSNAEVVLLGARGKPRRVSAGVHSVVMHPRGRHSQKPAEVRNRILALCGDLPRIELFAREAVPGWDRWGYDAPLGEGHIASLSGRRIAIAPEGLFGCSSYNRPSLWDELPETRQEGSEAEDPERQGTVSGMDTGSISRCNGGFPVDRFLTLETR